MLRQRVLTALVLIPLVVLAIWQLPTAWLAGIFGLLMLVSAWEWSLFIPLAGRPGRVVYVLAVALLLLLAHPAVYGELLTLPLLLTGLLWWLSAAVWLALYPGGFGPQRPRPLVRGLLGVLVTVPCYVAFWNLHAQPAGLWLIVVLLAWVWATDTGGYFAGKRYGRHALARKISPKKTWEGLAGGVVFALLLALGAALWRFAEQSLAGILALGLAVSLISIVGDLTISMFKRQTGIKDTGQLFPGHGGALDRLDSLFPAAPLLLVGYWLLGT